AEGRARVDDDPLEDAVGRCRDLDARLDEDDDGQRRAGRHPLALGDEPAIDERFGARFDVLPGGIVEADLDHATAVCGIDVEHSVRAVCTIDSAWGMTACSSGRLYGIGTSGTARRRTGARSWMRSRFSATIAAISPLRPKLR